MPLRTLARGCRRRRVVRPRVRGRSSSSGRAHYASGGARAPTSAASPRRRWPSGLRAAPARTPRRPRPRRPARAAPWSYQRRASAARRHSAVRARPSSQPAVPRAARRRSRRLATLRPANDASPSQQASREHDARPFPVVVPSRATPPRSQSMYSRRVLLLSQLSIDLNEELQKIQKLNFQKAPFEVARQPRTRGAGS